MSKDNESKGAGPSEIPSEDPASPKVRQKVKRDPAEETTVQPEISIYFSNPKVSPSAFIKAVKSKKVKRFKKDDEERARLALSEDVRAERLWALMSQASLPEAIDRWIWPAAQAQLKIAVGNDFDLLEGNPVQVLHNLRKSLAHGLTSKDKSKNNAAENWLRIGICWLVEKSSIDLWTLAEAISATYFDDTEKAKDVVERAISKGSIKEFRLSVANVRLGNAIVAKSKSDLTEEKRIANNLYLRLADAEKKTESLGAELATLRAQLAEKEAELQNVQTQLENERHHLGYDLAETKAEQRVLLGERVTPLLSDAIDALEIDVPSVALKRVKAVLKVIEEASS